MLTKYVRTYILLFLTIILKGFRIFNIELIDQLDLDLYN